MTILGGGSGGGASKLDDLSDVDLAGLSDDDILVFDFGSLLWKPEPAGAASDTKVNVFEAGVQIGSVARQLDFTDSNDFLITEDSGNDEIDIAINRNVANGIAGLDGSGNLTSNLANINQLPALTTNRALISDGAGVIIVSAVTNTELALLSGATTLELQANKGAVSGYAGLDASQELTNDLSNINQLPALTINRALISDGAGVIIVSAVTNTELALLSGATTLELQANKGAVSGYAGLDASQELLLTNFPSGTGLQVLRRNTGNTALEFATLSGGANHDILSATHDDSVTATLVRGDLITANSTPLWDRLPLGSSLQVLRVNVGATDLEYATPSSSSDVDVQVKEAGVNVGVPRNINFSDANDFLITEDSGNDEIDIAINRNVSNGIAGLDGSGNLTNDLSNINQLPALTTNRALISDGAGVIIVSAVTNTELALLDGATTLELQANKNQNSGYAGLDSNARLLLARLPIGAAFQRYRTNAGATAIENIDEEVIFAFIVGNGVDVATTGIKVVLRVEFACEITRWTMLAKESGSMVIDINRYTSLANYDSGTKASITGTDIPTLSSDKGNDSTALTGWTVVLNAGDILEAEIDSVATITRNTLSLRAKRR